MDIGWIDDESIDVEQPNTLRIEVGSTEDMFTDAVATATQFEDRAEVQVTVHGRQRLHRAS